MQNVVVINVKDKQFAESCNRDTEAIAVWLKIVHLIRSMQYTLWIARIIGRSSSLLQHCTIQKYYVLLLWNFEFFLNKLLKYDDCRQILCMVAIAQ